MQSFLEYFSLREGMGIEGDLPKQYDQFAQSLDNFHRGDYGEEEFAGYGGQEQGMDVDEIISWLRESAQKMATPGFSFRNHYNDWNKVMEAVTNYNLNKELGKFWGRTVQPQLLDMIHPSG
jgi:hypothetical protein